MSAAPHLIIIGGGLAGGLIARAFLKQRAEIEITLVEASDRLGGNHVWSFFEGDIRAEQRWLVEDLIVHRWPAYDIAFPAHRRTIQHPYHSIESERFDAVLRAELGAGLVFGAPREVRPDQVVLADGRVLEGAVIDARGPGDLATLEGGWQKFVGLSLRTSKPHGVERPIVMDATVAQLDGYRFVYVLPFGPDELFVEDTYYSDTAELEVETVRQRVLDYAAARGWDVRPGNRVETGVLPVITGGDFDGYWCSTGAGAKAGMRAGLCHPTTGYSLPDAVRLAASLVEARDLSPNGLETLTRAHARQAWRSRGYYRMLDTMLFKAALPHERYRVLERFYRLSPALIGRFYAGRSTLGDKLRILLGRPPVPITRAIKALTQ